MRSKIFIYLSLVLLFNVITACSAVTSYNRSPLIITDHVEQITIYWNTFSDANIVDTKINEHINKVLANKGYSDFEILYKSNNSLELGRRIYIIKYFKNSNDKESFLQFSETVIKQLQDELKSIDFNERWSKLNKNISVEETFRLLPELTKYYSNQTFFVGGTILNIENINLFFDEKGKLLHFERWKN